MAGNVGNYDSDCRKLMAAATAQGIDPASFTYRECLTASSGMPGAGRGLAGCAHPSQIPRPGGCTTWVRSGGVRLRAHEFGHNLGLIHANSRSEEYGDLTTIMGSAYGATNLHAEERHHLGVIDDSEVCPTSLWPPPLPLPCLHRPPSLTSAAAAHLLQHLDRCD
jgi:hypothetical protein